MNKSILKIIFGGVFGGVLGVCGINVADNTWEFLTIIVLFNVALFWE